MNAITHAILATLALLALSFPRDASGQAAPPPNVGLRPITERPGEPAPQPPTSSSSLDDQATLNDASITFSRTGTRALPVRSAFLLQSLQTGDEDLLTSLARRARAGYAYDAELEPIFSDRANIDLATNNPGDHTESHFTLANVQIAQGVYFRTEGLGRAFSADRRYTTLSAEAYFSLGANAGMSLGFDLVRTGLPDEDITALMDEGLFARFIIGF